MGKDHEWSLTGGTDDQFLLEDGLGEAPITVWEPMGGEKRKAPPTPKKLPSKSEEAYQKGYKDGQTDAEPDTFIGTLRHELREAAADTGALIGRELRNDWVRAVDDLLHMEPEAEAEEDKGPSKLRQAAGSAGSAAWRGTKRAASWTLRTGARVAKAWVQSRRAGSATQPEPMTDNLLEDPNVVDGEFWEVKDGS